MIDLSTEATRIGTLRWTAPRTSSSSRPGVHSKKRSDHSLSRGFGSLEDNWGASKSLVACYSSPLELLCDQTKLLFATTRKSSLSQNARIQSEDSLKSSHTEKNSSQHNHEAWWTKQNKKPSTAAAAAARNSQICLWSTSQFSPQGETNKQSSFQTTLRRESGYENSKLNPQFSQTTTVTAIDRREANKQQLQQYSEGSRDRAWATHIAGNWG